MNKKQVAEKAKKYYNDAVVATGVTIATVTPAFAAADGTFDLTTGLVAASVITGVVAAGKRYA